MPVRRLGMVVKGCDMMGVLELAKRKQVNLDNILMIGVNCGGSVSPVTARKMITEKYGVDPDTVTRKRSTRASSSSSTMAATRAFPSMNSKRQAMGGGATAAGAR